MKTNGRLIHYLNNHRLKICVNFGTFYKLESDIWGFAVQGNFTLNRNNETNQWKAIFLKNQLITPPNTYIDGS